MEPKVINERGKQRWVVQVYRVHRYTFFFKYICTGTTGAQVGCRINRTCSTVSGTTGRCVQVVGVYMTCTMCTTIICGHIRCSCSVHLLVIYLYHTCESQF